MLNVNFEFIGDASTAICGFERLQCLSDSVQSIIAEKLKNITLGGVDSCNCLPACTQISYDHEISQASLDFHSLMEAFDTTISDLNSRYN